jgi:hypothetical protein
MLQHFNETTDSGCKVAYKFYSWYEPVLSIDTLDTRRIAEHM